ncbi:MAG: hypothetical protein K9K88_15800 [Desulfobacterales bacterium]|nr:hypothetical protein [Desulfobacterales bacterium]
MGKNSLIKSTSKKTAEKDADEKKKKTAAKSKKAAKGAPAKAKKAAAATAAKSKAGSKSKKGSKPKTAAQTPPKTKTAAKPKKTAPKKKAAKAQAPKKAVSIKDLLFQKFDSWTPESVFSPPKHEPTGRNFTAPPLISTDDPDEAERIRALLFLKFDEASLKSAAEKAKTEQAAAQKAEADKAFIQKAAAEKAAAEKTAAKKAEQEPEVSVSYPPPPKAAEPADPMEKAFKYGIAGFAVLLVILIGVSFANKGNYYLESANGGLKIYQGRFSPMGKELMITLPGVAAPAPAEEAYTMSQVYPLIYNYYLDKADALLGAQGLPDYQGIRRYLNEALKYAPTNEARKAVYERLDGIELMALLYRADIAARKGTIESLEESLDYLNQAAGLEIDESQAELIDQKREAVRAAIEEKKAQAEAGKTPAE